MEDKKTIGDFQSFVQVVSDSKVDVQIMQKDSFIECLEENSCISGDMEKLYAFCGSFGKTKPANRRFSRKEKDQYLKKYLNDVKIQEITFLM